MPGDSNPGRCARDALGILPHFRHSSGRCTCGKASRTAAPF